MNKRLLRLDYDALARELQCRLHSDDPDTPLEFDFDACYRVLSRLETAILEELTNPSSDQERELLEYAPLIEVLFADLGGDTIDDMSVSNVPGHVVRHQGRSELLPLIVIKVSSSR